MNKITESYLEYINETQIPPQLITIALSLGILYYIRKQDAKLGECFKQADVLQKSGKVNKGFNNRRVAIFTCRIKFCENILQTLRSNRNKCENSPDKDRCYRSVDNEIYKFQKLLDRYTKSRKKVQDNKFSLVRIV